MQAISLSATPIPVSACARSACPHVGDLAVRDADLGVRMLPIRVSACRRSARPRPREIRTHFGSA
jgi:hypothetical protein